MGLQMLKSIKADLKIKKMSNKVVLALACAAFVGASLVGVGASAAVTHLKQSNFDETVSDGKVHFIKFYAPVSRCLKLLIPHRLLIPRLHIIHTVVWTL